MATENPLTAQPPIEVPLASAPLVRVIAQVRFPLVASIEKQEFIGPFQEAIRREYPILRQERESGIVLTPAGISDAQTKTVWRFLGAGDKWRVSLASGFIALETTSYSNRKEFLQRLETILFALHEHIKPGLADRLGIRYIDRIEGPAMEDFPALVKKEFAGVLATDLSAHVLHSFTECLFSLPGGGNLLLRSGRLPAGATVDPGAIEPVDTSSWILDLDAFAADLGTFDVNAICQLAGRFAERLYTVFRWVVTEEFLRRYGGQV
jgi:uncharacterized protein (TIGR04255 family)